MAQHLLLEMPSISAGRIVWPGPRHAAGRYGGFEKRSLIEHLLHNADPQISSGMRRPYRRELFALPIDRDLRGVLAAFTGAPGAQLMLLAEFACCVASQERWGAVIAGAVVYGQAIIWTSSRSVGRHRLRGGD
ncbi:hypothetical protein [Pseudomonas sp. CGJS7]|uniref:hypothetical protein n=1 Tax=Pseudomonas sp. CGJS7 TaxID=3109348 RepID=UPI0030094A29